MRKSFTMKTCENQTNSSSDIISSTCVENAIGSTDNSAHLIIKVREDVLEVHRSSPGRFNEEDIKRVESDDWFVKKFLVVSKKNVNSASSMLVNTLDWRKSQGLYAIKDTDLPDVWYRLGSFFVYEADKNGRPVFYGRIKHYRRNSDLRPIVIQQGIAMGLKIEKEATDGIAGIMDFQKLQLTKAFDLEIVRILITTLLNHFPMMVRVIYVINLNPILSKFSSMFMSLMPASARNRVKFLTPKGLTKYIDESNIPDFLGGTCKRPYKGDLVVPEGCPDLVEYGKRNGWTRERYTNIYKIALELCEEEKVTPPPPPELYSDDVLLTLNTQEKLN